MPFAPGEKERLQNFAERIAAERLAREGLDGGEVQHVELGKAAVMAAKALRAGITHQLRVVEQERDDASE